jgi:hypothetical protein
VCHKDHIGIEIFLHSLLISAVLRSKRKVSRSGCFTPGERAPFINVARHRTVPQTSLDILEKKKIFALA